MTRSPLVSLWVMAAAIGAGSAVAADTSPMLKSDLPPATAATPAQPRSIAPTVSTRPRLVSPTATKKLDAALPKFEAAAREKPAEPLPDLREIDKPRNTIIRLPEYVVQEQEPPILKEREVATPKSRLERAFKRNPGLRLGSFWIFRNDGIALAMLEEEERLERMKETYDMITLLPASQQKQIKPLVDQTFMRP